MRAVFGRVETIEVSGKPVSILLIKNPAGANEVLRTLSLESSDGGLDVWIALNDKIADGRDVSWIWDADFELLSRDVRRVICTGTRASEMALRLKYAGWPDEAIEVIEPIGTSLDHAVTAAPSASSRSPHTALLELRTLLAHRRLAPVLGMSLLPPHTPKPQNDRGDLGTLEFGSPRPTAGQLAGDERHGD